MRACARVALASIAVSASFSLSGCAAIEELKETLLRWVESQKLASEGGVSAEHSEANPTGEDAEGAKQAAPTAEGCGAQTATPDRCASSKETTDPVFE
jgi:hypothetical protein